jgi:hypothetical protein
MPTPLPALRSAVRFPTRDLQFDTLNPRFTEDHSLGKASDADVIEFLLTTADLGELVHSIASNGYIDIEPLVVMEDRKKIVVLEGNRRLAAIKILSDPKYAKLFGGPLPDMTPKNQTTLEQVTVYRVPDRESARDFIGFKHINGPHRWDSLAKARFAAEWYKRERTQGTTLKDISRKMGDRHDTIQRMVAAIFVLDQAKKEGVFDLRDRAPERPFAFSHLYTALTRPGYRTYLDLDSDWREEDPQPNPVPKKAVSHLKEVLVWLYGSKKDGIDPIVTSQNPHVKELGAILENPKARAILVSTQNRAKAYRAVETPARQFEKDLIDAHMSAESALGSVNEYDGDPSLLEISSGLKGKAEVIYQEMNKLTKASKRFP